MSANVAGALNVSLIGSNADMRDIFRDVLRVAGHLVDSREVEALTTKILATAQQGGIVANNSSDGSTKVGTTPTTLSPNATVHWGHHSTASVGFFKQATASPRGAATHGYNLPAKSFWSVDQRTSGSIWSRFPTLHLICRDLITARREELDAGVRSAPLPASEEDKARGRRDKLLLAIRSLPCIKLETPLHCAVAQMEPSIVKAMLQLGAQPDFSLNPLAALYVQAQDRFYAELLDDGEESDCNDETLPRRMTSSSRSDEHRESTRSVNSNLLSDAAAATPKTPTVRATTVGIEAPTQETDKMKRNPTPSLSSPPVLSSPRDDSAWRKHPNVVNQDNSGREGDHERSATKDPQGMNGGKGRTSRIFSSSSKDTAASKAYLAAPLVDEPPLSLEFLKQPPLVLLTARSTGMTSPRDSTAKIREIRHLLQAESLRKRRVSSTPKVDHTLSSTKDTDLSHVVDTSLFKEATLVQWDSVYAVAELLESETFVKTLEQLCDWYIGLAPRPWHRVARFWRFYGERVSGKVTGKGEVNIGTGGPTLLKNDPQKALKNDPEKVSIKDQTSINDGPELAVAKNTDQPVGVNKTVTSKSGNLKPETSTSVGQETTQGTTTSTTAETTTTESSAKNETTDVETVDDTASTAAKKVVKVDSVSRDSSSERLNARELLNRELNARETTAPGGALGKTPKSDQGGRGRATAGVLPDDAELLPGALPGAVPIEDSTEDTEEVVPPVSSSKEPGKGNANASRDTLMVD
ncbi:unnamed protein product [Amoebophrya sp. A25]|nr:unnamed protein product [Amoebophrya sp. A25]|eukprot:GSA25T00008805001.1